MTQTAAPAVTGGHALVTLDGRYHVVERIAAGGMGEVFRAHDAVLSREVAIKVLHRSLAGDQNFVERFRREARAAATLNHPNIVAVYDWGAVDGIYYMVMEFVRGRSVREVLNANVRLFPAQAVEIVHQTLLALEHAHAKGIVHRDLKPENIMVTADGVVKLTDLGLARAFADGTATRTGGVTGTVQYLAPEQIRGEPADPRSDLYSLGIVTYELLTGRLPFTGETPMSIAYKHLSDRVPAPSALVPDVGEDLDGFVASATDRDRELRPESARAMCLDAATIAEDLPPARSLASLVQDLPEVLADGEATEVVKALETAQIPRVERRRRRRLRKLVLGVLILGMLAAAAWGAWAYLLPRTALVPEGLAGVTIDRARAALDEVGLTARIGDGRHHLRVPEGSVITVQPAAGTELEWGETVTLIPSLGPPPVDVPKIVGSSLEDARAALVDATLAPGEVTRRFHDTVPAGHVIRQSTPSGRTLPQGSEVDLVVSRGHAPEDVPSVAGLRQQGATRALGARGFDVAVQTGFSDRVDKGLVMTVSPEEGSTQPYGATVTITVSLGPEQFPAPSFMGLSRAAAHARAAEWGLELAILPVPGTDGSSVISQLPGVGTTVRYGQTITVYVA